MAVPADDIRGQTIIYLRGRSDIAALVGNNVFPTVIPESIQLESVIAVSLISSEVGKGLAGHYNWQKSNVQIDCYDIDVEKASLIYQTAKMAIIKHNQTIGQANVQSTTLAGEFTSEIPPKDASDRWWYGYGARFDITFCPELR